MSIWELIGYSLGALVIAPALMGLVGDYRRHRRRARRIRQREGG
ncbi:MAG: hypothetical protein AAF737_04170 [Pseudomonadota bacterium]